MNLFMWHSFPLLAFTQCHKVTNISHHQWVKATMNNFKIFKRPKRKWEITFVVRCSVHFDWSLLWFMVLWRFVVQNAYICTLDRIHVSIWWTVWIVVKPIHEWFKRFKRTQEYICRESTVSVTTWNDVNETPWWNTLDTFALVFVMIITWWLFSSPSSCSYLVSVQVQWAADFFNH